MNASDEQLLALALKKQRLQFENAALRERLVYHTSFLVPLCAGADQMRGGWRWLKARPAISVAIAVALIVSRPRGAWRWIRRGFGVWQIWRKIRRLTDSALEPKLRPQQ